MAHLLKDPVTGHLMHNQNNGHLANECEGCEHCPDATPRQYTVAISGLVSCPCTDDGSMSAEGTCTIDASFVVTRDPGDPCFWTNPDVGTLRIQTYSDTGCTYPVDDETKTAYAWLRRIAGQFIFQIEADGFTHPASGEAIAIAFRGTKETVNCDDSFSVDDDSICFVNELSATAYKLCEDGTATITPV